MDCLGVRTLAWNESKSGWLASAALGPTRLIIISISLPISYTASFSSAISYWVAFVLGIVSLPKKFFTSSVKRCISSSLPWFDNSSGLTGSFSSSQKGFLAVLSSRQRTKWSYIFIISSSFPLARRCLINSM